MIITTELMPSERQLCVDFRSGVQWLFRNDVSANQSSSRSLGYRFSLGLLTNLRLPTIDIADAASVAISVSLRFSITDRCTDYLRPETTDSFSIDWLSIGSIDNRFFLFFSLSNLTKQVP